MFHPRPIGLNRSHYYQNWQLLLLTHFFQLLVLTNFLKSEQTTKDTTERTQTQFVNSYCQFNLTMRCRLMFLSIINTFAAFCHHPIIRPFEMEGNMRSACFAIRGYICTQVRTLEREAKERDIRKRKNTIGNLLNQGRKWNMPIKAKKIDLEVAGWIMRSKDLVTFWGKWKMESKSTLEKVSHFLIFFNEIEKIGYTSNWKLIVLFELVIDSGVLSLDGIAPFANIIAYDNWSRSPYKFICKHFPYLLVIPQWKNCLVCLKRTLSSNKTCIYET